MNNTALQVFNFQGGNPIRTFIRDGATWWVAKDICDVLEISNSRDAVDRLDEDEKDVGVFDTPGGAQDMNIISESGLYNLIFRSNKPEAKNFRKWVTSEVLPALRKTGKFDMGQSAAPTASSMPLMEKLNGMLIRTVTKDGKPWWLFKDICDVFEIGGEQLRRLNHDEKDTFKMQVLGDEKEMNIVSESGLYNLIFRSCKPAAKDFCKWVTSEVLTNLHRTGEYKLVQEDHEQIYQRKVEDMKNFLAGVAEHFAEGKVSKRVFEAIILSFFEYLNSEIRQTLSIADTPVTFFVPKSDLWDIKKAKRLVITID